MITGKTCVVTGGSRCAPRAQPARAGAQRRARVYHRLAAPPRPPPARPPRGIGRGLVAQLLERGNTVVATSRAPPGDAAAAGSELAPLIAKHQARRSAAGARGPSVLPAHPAARAPRPPALPPSFDRRAWW